MTEKLKRGHKKVYRLTDGTNWTLEELVAVSGINFRTMYHRLHKGERDYEVLMIKPKPKVKGEMVYTLTDGSQWTATSLAKHLNCKRATAQSRFYSRFELDPKRVLAPVKGGATFEEEVIEHTKNRMFNDPDGFWGIFNKMTGVVK